MGRNAGYLTEEVQRTITPKHENLRRALRWLADQDSVSRATIEAASVRFDLGPRDEQFLLEHVVTEKPDERSPD
jgi:hypothetical protein